MAPDRAGRRDIGANDAKGAGDVEAAIGEHRGHGIARELAQLGIFHLGVEAAADGAPGHIAAQVEIDAGRKERGATRFDSHQRGLAEGAAIDDRPLDGLAKELVTEYGGLDLLK